MSSISTCIEISTQTLKISKKNNKKYQKITQEKKKELIEMLKSKKISLAKVYLLFFQL